MRRAWLYRALLCAGVPPLVASGCASDLLSLEGKRCDANRACVDGFVCNERTDRCVRPAELSAGDAGPGGPFDGFGGGLGGAGGAGSVGGSSSGAVGGSSLGGTSALGTGGNSVLTPGDAGPDAALPSGDGGCAGRIYRDDDGDGVGDTTEFIEDACPEPGWVSQPGDCRDDLDDVFPGQTVYFSTPYNDPLASADVSFDYDCNNVEEPDPNNTSLGAPPDCGSVLGVGCASDSGFLPFSPARSGPGVEPRCGSNLLRDCSPATLGCGPEDTAVAAELAFRCK